MTRMQEEVLTKESRWTEATLKKVEAAKRRGQNGNEDISKEIEVLNGSAWSTEKKYMKRYKGMFDIFFGIEHRLRKEDMDRCSENYG